MATEYDCKCNSCGQTWSYNDADIRDIQNQVGQMKGRLALGVVSAARGGAVNPTWQANRIEDMAENIPDLRRCPNCGSMDVAVTATEVNNPFLDDPSSSMYMDKEQFQAVPDGSKSKVAAGLLGIFLGAFGVHKFYLGYVKEGLIALAICLIGGVLTMGAATGVMGIIGLIEGIVYLTKNNAAFYNTYVQGHKGWF